MERIMKKVVGILGALVLALSTVTMSVSAKTGYQGSLYWDCYCGDKFGSAYSEYIGGTDTRAKIYSIRFGGISGGWSDYSSETKTGRESAFIQYNTPRNDWHCIFVDSYHWGTGSSGTYEKTVTSYGG